MLGENLGVVGFAIKGDTTKDKSKELVDAIIESLGMKKARKSVIWDYPFNGAGGNGFTLIQPITESAVYFDSWPDLRGAYLVINSCKPINMNTVIMTINKQGFKVLPNQLFSKSLRLKNGL